MTMKEAREITGGLSNPSKMPGKGYSLPPSACPTGAWLRRTTGSVCNGCYACKGRYNFNNVQEAMRRRLASLTDTLHTTWVEAMTLLIKKDGCPWFRWHDSGDLQSYDHLCRICRVCEATPEVHYRLPTREYSIVFRYLKYNEIPKNLTIRLSAFMVGETVPFELDNLPLAASMVFKEDSEVPEGAFICPATTERHECGDCRYCWGRANKCVAYKAH
jgi:hypothetical protein